MKKIFAAVVFLFFVSSFNFCFASHSKQIFVFSGTANEIYNTGNQIFSWYVDKNSMKLNSEKKIASAYLFAYDENDKWKSSLDEMVSFSIIPSPKKNGKYRIIRWLNTYEEYMQNNRKFYAYVKKDTIYGNLYKIMKKNINLDEMLPMDKSEVNEIVEHKLEYIRIIEKEKIINAGL